MAKISAVSENAFILCYCHPLFPACIGDFIVDKILYLTQWYLMHFCKVMAWEESRNNHLWNATHVCIVQRMEQRFV